MIRINNGLNEVIVTLKEKTTLQVPVYLFALKNQITNLETFFIAQDTSGYPERFNRFLVLVNDGVNPLSGEIELTDTGYYSYKIYEQESSENLDPLNALNKVEDGILKFEHTSQQNDFYTSQVRVNNTYKNE
jgi:uncharacterized protein YjfI (DUF2170 family)